VDRPSFLQFLPGQDAAVPLAEPFSGILAQQGPCLGLLRGEFFSTVVWPETARVEYDRDGLVLRDGLSGSSARLGDRIEALGGPLPAAARLQLGPPTLNLVMPIECARRPIPQDPAWSGPGWIAVVNPGFRVIASIPIVLGAYGVEDRSCGERASLFHYDGHSLGWNPSGSAERVMYPIRRVREENGQWVATVIAPGPGVSGAASPQEVEVAIVPRGGGRITVTSWERIEMKLCPPGALPVEERPEGADLAPNGGDSYW
jgi:hypothetical protein